MRATVEETEAQSELVYSTISIFTVDLQGGTMGHIPSTCTVMSCVG